MGHNRSARSIYCLSFMRVLLSFLGRKKTAIACVIGNYGLSSPLYSIPGRPGAAKGRTPPLLSPFLPNLLRPNLLRPGIRVYFSIWTRWLYRWKCSTCFEIFPFPLSRFILPHFYETGVFDRTGSKDLTFGSMFIIIKDNPKTAGRVRQCRLIL